MSDKYGFVYLWYDKKHKRYYVGCRWGTVDDGYICSSRWMRKAYKRRPEDFKRRILKKVYTNRQDLLVEEHKYLSLITEEKLGKRYYNVYNHQFGHWSSDETQRQLVAQKLKNVVVSDETRAKQRAAKLGKSNPHKGKTLEELHGAEKAEEVRRNLAEAHLGQVAWNKGKEYHQIRGENHWAYGKGLSPESIEKMRQTKTGKKMPATTGENHWTAKRKRELLNQ